MARRKKRSKAAAAAKAREKERSPMITEKSLPALPPNVIPNNAFSNDRVDPESDTPTELSPRPRLPGRQTDSSRGGSSRPERSPERQNSNSSRPEGLGLPAHTYRNNRNSTIISSNEPSGRDSDDGFFIPVALDPSPAPSAPSRTASDAAADPSKRKDYFSPKTGTSERRNDSTSSTPHIAFQEKGRQPSDPDGSQVKQSSRKVSRSSPAVEPEAPPRPSPARKPGQESFKLQEAPKTRQMIAASQSSSEQSSPPQELAGSPARPSEVPARPDRDEFPGKLVGESTRSNENTPPRPSQEMRSPDEDSLGGAADSNKLQKPVKRKEVPSTRNRKFSSAKLPYVLD